MFNDILMPNYIKTSIIERQCLVWLHLLKVPLPFCTK